MSNELVTFISLFGCLFVVRCFRFPLFVVIVLFIMFWLAAWKIYHEQSTKRIKNWERERNRHMKFIMGGQFAASKHQQQQVDEIKMTQESISCLWKIKRENRSIDRSATQIQWTKKKNKLWGTYRWFRIFCHD